MVFVKFHNMNRKKNFLMSPLYSNKLKTFHFTTSQNIITITVHKCSVFFSSFFNLCTVYFTKKYLFFLSFFIMLCSTMFMFFSFFYVFFPLSCTFLFLFFVFIFPPFFHNKLLIQCPFPSTLYLPLFVFTLKQ